MSAIQSRANSAARMASAAASRKSSAAFSRKSTAASSRSMSARSAMIAGGPIVSRPATAKSVAWSDDGKDEKQPPMDSAVDKGETGAGLSKELEEELNRDLSNKEEENIGCWQKFTAFVASFWETTDMHAGEEKEVVVRTTLRELVIYLVFLALLCIVTLTAMEPTMYRYTNVLRTLFLKVEDVRTVDQFFDFMEKDFVDGVYLEEWYNEGENSDTFPCPGSPNATGPCPIALKDRMILYSNRLLGVPRLRLLRVHNESCSIPPQFESSIKACYGPYSSGIEDKSDFGLLADENNFREYTSADAWRYQSVKELNGQDHWGLLAWYSGAGSVQNLREEKELTLDIIKELKEGLWITRGTRYVVVDFTLYNANVNLFCVIKLNFEFPATGGIVPHPQFGTVKLLRYITPFEYAIMGCEFVFAVFVIYYLIEEILEIRKVRLAYFTSFWNLLDLFVIFVSVATLSFNLYTVYQVSTLLKGLLAEPELWADFSFLEVWSKNFQDAAALTVFVGWIKVFKYISFNKTMTQLAGTISRCAGDVAAFSIMFFIVFLAYAQVGYLLFGAHMKEFSTLKDASFTQFRLILGDFDFPAIQKSHRFWGPVYFLTYVFMVFFVLMNMFLAIINDTYSEVKEEVDNRREEFQVGDYVKRGYNNVREMFMERDKVIDIKETVKLAADDGVVTYDEVRESLRKKNFSDLEIEIFCARYDKDGDYRFDLDEINAIEQNLGEQMMNHDHLYLETEKFGDGDRPDSTMPKMNKAQFTIMEIRVNKMEQQMSEVIDKVDQALKKLDTTGRKKSAMNKGMRDIMSGKDGEEARRRKMEQLVNSELDKIEESD